MLLPQIASDLLPIQVWRNILFQVDLTDIHSAKRTCKVFNNIADERFLLAKFHSLLPNIDNESLKKRLEIASINFRSKIVTKEAQIALKGHRLDVEYEKLQKADSKAGFEMLIANSLKMESWECAAVLAVLATNVPRVDINLPYGDVGNLLKYAEDVIGEKKIKNPLFLETLSKMNVKFYQYQINEIIFEYFDSIPEIGKYSKLESFILQLLQIADGHEQRDQFRKEISDCFIGCLGLAFANCSEWIKAPIQKDRHIEIRGILEQIKRIHVSIDHEWDESLDETTVYLRLRLLEGIVIGMMRTPNFSEDDLLKAAKYFKKILCSFAQEDRGEEFYITLFVGATMISPEDIFGILLEIVPDVNEINKKFIRRACYVLASGKKYSALLSLAGCFLRPSEMIQLERAVDSIHYDKLAKRYPATAAGLLALRNRGFIHTGFIHNGGKDGTDKFTSISGRIVSLAVGVSHIWDSLRTFVSIPYQLLTREFPPKIVKLDLLTLPWWHIAYAIKCFAGAIIHPGIVLKSDVEFYYSPHYYRISEPFLYYENATRNFNHYQDVDPLLREMLKEFLRPPPATN